MARMSVDDSALRDPRVRRLAGFLMHRFGPDLNHWPDFARRYTMGLLLEVWSLPYDRESNVVPVIDVNDAAMIDDFHRALIDADLATSEPGGVYIRGSRKRTAYLAARIDAGKEGGRESGRRRRTRKAAAAPEPATGPALVLASRLFDLVVAANPQSRIAARKNQRDKIASQWSRHIVKLHAEGAPYEKIADAIEWSQRDSFWRGIVMSTKKLRDRWDQVLAQMARPTNGVNGTNGHHGRVEPRDDADYSRAPWE